MLVINLDVCIPYSVHNFLLQDSDILAPAFPSTVQVAYILSLGVVVDYRKHGIGRAIIITLQNKYFREDSKTCIRDHLY